MHVKNVIQPRLTTRYKRLATIIGVVFLLIALISTGYVATIKSSSSARLQQLSNIKQLSSKIRYQVDDAQLKLNNLLLSSSTDVEVSPIKPVDQAIEDAQALQQQVTIFNNAITQNLPAMAEDLQSYRSFLLDLLDKRKDLSWLYPALPFINGSMLDANQQFESAVLLVIDELKEESENPYSNKTFQYFYESNDLWRRIILNFRAMLIRFSGLQNVPLGASAEEQNILLLFEELNNRLNMIEKINNQGLLSFQGEDALKQMREGSQDWKKGFEQLRNMRLSIYWRADIEYLNTKITPIQEAILVKLGKLEEQTDSLSQEQLSVFESVLDQLIILFWLIAIFTLIIIFMGYSDMQKLILRPIARVAEALWAESHGKTPANLSAASTYELEQLVGSFSAMRKQVAERQQALEYQALHDSLTALPNRVLLNDRLEHQINLMTREDGALALMIMDLNGFKEINDTLGHQVGDLVLVEIAERLQKQIRNIDTVARMGGDEFAVLLPDVDRDQAAILVERVIQSLEANLDIGGHKLHISASIGITMYPENGLTAKSLVQRADVAMYKAKRSHTPYEFYDRDQDTHNIGWLTLPAELEEAIKNNQLELFYQPKVEAASGELKGVEALLRWQHPRHGWINPEDIIELAESSAMIDDLAIWVIEQALSDYILWQQQGISLNMAINLSPQNLHNQGFIDQVAASLSSFGVEGEALTIEITENAFFRDPAQAAVNIHRLGSLGIRIAIDDYGTGFSSLSYLRQLAVNELKIDKVFIMNLHQSDDDVTIVRSTISMAQNLGLEVVAEGVENAFALQLLRELGCDLLQGYFISPPVSMPNFLTWLDEWEGYTHIDTENKVIK